MLSALGPIRKAGGGGGGGGGAGALLAVTFFVCARVRDSAWGAERGGAAMELVPGGGILYQY